MNKTLDLFEYPTAAAAQAAYVSSDSEGAEEILQSHADVNSNKILGDYTDIEWRVAQKVVLTEDAIITKAKFTFIDAIGSPVGDVTLTMETDNSGLPSGILVDANATKAITPAHSAENTWDFATDFYVPPGTYWLVFHCDDQDTTNVWRVGTNTAGNDAAKSNDGGESWEAASETLQHKLYGKVVHLQCYPEAIKKVQGDYSLKVIAKQTDSLNDTLTKTLTGGDKIDLSGINTFKLWGYASRTGTNIEVKLHDSGGNTITISIAIPTAGAWTEITKDISAVADIDKDDIDEIKIEIIEAGALNTFYVDDFYGVEIAAYPIARLNKNRISGYHCFMDQYLRASREELTPLKLPDGTVF